MKIWIENNGQAAKLSQHLIIPLASVVVPSNNLRIPMQADTSRSHSSSPWQTDDQRCPSESKQKRRVTQGYYHLTPLLTLIYFIEQLACIYPGESIRLSCPKGKSDHATCDIHLTLANINIVRATHKQNGTTSTQHESSKIGKTKQNTEHVGGNTDTGSQRNAFQQLLVHVKKKANM